MTDELAKHIQTLDHDASYRVVSTLKSSDQETTELVTFVGANQSELGPFIRKRFKRDAPLGSAYALLYQAQQSGRRFLHVPAVFESYTLGDEDVVVMEYLKGETLYDVVYRCNPSVALAADVFPQLCDAVLEFQESCNPPLIHRDIKPSNIILSKNNLSIIDFGISRTYKPDVDYDTHHFGTREYAAPEQFGFGQTDVRTDVFALGQVLWFCLTEQNPTQRTRLEGYHDPRVPEAYRQIIVKATSFDPNDRYANVHELKDVFTAATKQLGSLVPQVPTPVMTSSSTVSGNNQSKMEQLLQLSPRHFIQTTIMVLLSLLILVACITSALDPLPTSSLAGYPLWVRMGESVSLAIFFFLPLFYLGCSHKLLGIFFPFEKNMTWPKRILVPLVGLSLTCISFVFFQMLV